MRFEGNQATSRQGQASFPGQDPSSIPELFRNATDSLVELVAAHVRLTNLELVADLEDRTRLVVTQLVVSLVGVIGYGLAMVAVGLAAGAVMARWAAFLVLGGVHLAAAAIGALILSRRRRHALQVDRAVHSLGKSVTVVADAVLGSAGQDHART
jgi:hypothetical protein